MVNKCLFGLTMAADAEDDGPVMTYDGFMHILQKVAADDESFRTEFEADPAATMEAAGYEIDLSRYDYSATIQLPTAAAAQNILQDYLTDIAGDRLAGMGGVQNLADSVQTRINTSAS